MILATPNWTFVNDPIKDFPLHKDGYYINRFFIVMLHGGRTIIAYPAVMTTPIWMLMNGHDKNIENTRATAYLEIEFDDEMMPTIKALRHKLSKLKEFYNEPRNEIQIT